MERPEIIMAPGPTPVPPEVLLAQGSPLVYHRGPGYGDLLREVTESLKKIFRTYNDVVIFASSGTGGLESAVANLFSPGDTVIVPVAGYFGDRFARIAQAFGQDVRRLDYEWGLAIRPEDVKAALAETPGVKGVLVQHSETSTGVVNDIEAIGRVTREASVLLVVDVISSLGAVPYEGDAWGIDVAVGGSQKAFSATPGLSFVSISGAAWEATKKARNPRFYFDWAQYKKSYELASPENPFTPAISLMLGMRAALRRYFEEGPDAVLERHRILSAAVKEGVRALGLDLSGEHLGSGGHRWRRARGQGPSRPRDHPGAGPGADEGPGVSHRPPRQLRPIRYHSVPGRPRAHPGGDGVSREAWIGCGGRGGRLRRDAVRALFRLARKVVTAGP